MIRNSFTLRVLAISFLLLALPLLIDSFIFFQNSYDEAISDAKKDLRQQVRIRTYTLLASEPVKQVLLRELIYLLNIHDQMTPEQYAALSKELAVQVHHWGEYQIYVLALGENGSYKILASSNPEDINSYFWSHTQLEKVLSSGSGTFIRYVLNPESQRAIPYLYAAQTVDSVKTGKPAFIVMVRANIEKEVTAALTPIAQLPNAQFAILNDDGVVFAATDPRLVGQHFLPLSDTRREQLISTQQISSEQLAKDPLPVIQGQDPPFFEFIFNNGVQIAYEAYISEVRLSLIGYLAKEVFFGEAVRNFLLVYSLYGVILVAGAAVTYWFSLWISRPLRQLSHVMGEVSRGNLEIRFKEEPLGFEINILGGMFNHTLGTLLQTIQHAEDERVKKETYERELAIGRQVQRSLLPALLPTIPGAQFAGTYLPANDVGGDFYAYMNKTTSNGHDVVAIAVADAAGRGISSCLYSLSARSLLRAHTTLSDDVGVILSATNNAFIRDTTDTGMYVTLLFGMYDVESKQFSYYSCGHVPGIVYKADGQMASLKCSGIALGLKESEPYASDELQLSSGDTLILYTDGLLDVIGAPQKQDIQQWLKELFTGHPCRTAQEVIDTMRSGVEQCALKNPQEEEVIIVALKVD